MKESLRKLMLEWLESGTDQQKAHAANRLSMPDAKGRPPSTSAMIGGAVGAAVGFASSGFRVADAAERERRLDICRGCPEFDAGRCRKCGCYMKLKARIAAAHCPIGKW